MARKQAIIRVTKNNYQQVITTLPESRLEQILKNLLVGIIGNYLYNLKHPDNRLIPPMLPSGQSLEKLNEAVGSLVLSGKKMKIVDAYEHIPDREIIRLTLAASE